MAECDWCGGEIVLESAFSCNYCDRKFCGEHRLPETHNCIGVRSYHTLGPDVVNLKEDQQTFIGGDPSEADAKAEDSKREKRTQNRTRQRDEADTQPCKKCGEPSELSYCADCRKKILNERWSDSPENSHGEEKSQEEDEGAEPETSAGSSGSVEASESVEDQQTSNGMVESKTQDKPVENQTSKKILRRRHTLVVLALLLASVGVAAAFSFGFMTVDSVPAMPLADNLGLSA